DIYDESEPTPQIPLNLALESLENISEMVIKSPTVDLLIDTSTTIAVTEWKETQTNLKLTLQRRIYGIHAPLRHMIERSIVSKAERLPGLPSSNFGLEILMGEDETID
ncbi:9927_t:CDS:2, partial [Gigaspora rosea]